MSTFIPSEIDLENTAILNVYINNINSEWKTWYQTHIDQHNENIKDIYPNAGFDLFIMEDISLINPPEKSTLVNLQIKAEMTFQGKPCGYYIFPRSSISKTPLMLANHTGIIDSGYRGYLMAAFRSFSPSYLLEKHTRIVQICHPSLCKIYVKILENESDLTDTTRGSGGFGSTGK